jgi:hypothetical protein
MYSRGIDTGRDIIKKINRFAAISQKSKQKFWETK